MNYKGLQDEILILVDSSTDEIDALVPDLVNDAVQAIANEPGIILPSLKTIRNISTELDQEYAALEGAFNGKLLFAAAGGVKINAHKTLEDLLEDYPTMREYGSVEAIALEGSTIWYAKIPEEVETMTLLLCLNPDIMTLNEEIPSCIPEHLHRQTIIPYVAKTMFDMIEQEDDTEKTQTKVNEFAYMRGVQKLREYLAARRRGMSRSIWNI